MSTQSTAAPSRRWLQFGLKTLLFVMLCIAGMLAGYRAGYYRGVETKRRESIYAKVYYVQDLATAPDGSEDFDTLIQIVTKSIAPDSWDVVGGPGSIQEFPSNKSLVVHQSGEAHDKIADLFAEMRKQDAGAKQSAEPPR